MRGPILGWMLVLMGLGSAAGSAPPAPATPREPAGLRIESDTALPKPLEWAADVRWATDRTVYLGLAMDGVVEASVDPAGGSPKEMIPGRAKLGGFWSTRRVAASPRFLVAAAWALSLTWRSLDNPLRTEEAFEVIEAIDVRDDRLAIVGGQRDEKRKFAPDGAIAWVGPIEKGLPHLRPLLYDVAGPGAPTLDHCIDTGLAAVRFLADGSLLVVPGIQPGIQLYDGQGKLVRTWETATLGIDADCASLGEERGHWLAAHVAERRAWVNQRRTVDAVLPLEQGPGLLVRKVEKGHARWELKILRPDGSVLTYQVPVEGNNEFFSLRGDVRDGKIVLLLWESVFRGSGKEHPTPPRLILAQLPKG